MNKETVILCGVCGAAGALLWKAAPVPSGGVNEVAVQKIAEAIATAEGFFVRGSRPARNHNPGNVTLDIGGNTAKAVGRDGIYMIYANDADGWEDLRQQIRFMLNGKSRIYLPSDTIAEVAKKYTTTEQREWAANVARKLGVSVDTKLQEVA